MFFKAGNFTLNNMDLQLLLDILFSYANKWPNPADPCKLGMDSQVYLSYHDSLS